MTVRRRRPDSPSPVPERLARFAVSEWTGFADTEDAVWAWAAEREAWALANPIEWSAGYLTSPLGDRLDRLRQRREAWLMTWTERDPEEFNGGRATV